MSLLDTATAPACPQQVYLIDRDAGLLCRSIGLYAASAIEVLQVDYADAAQGVMRLRVKTGCAPLDAGDAAESVRILVEKVSTLVGVVAAAADSEDTAHGLACPQV